MLQKSIIPFTLLLALSIICFGQKDLENGYIIKNDGTQIHGLIDIQSNVQNSKSCLFQNTEQGTLESFSADDITGYKTNSKYYISQDVLIDSVKHRVFLEYLVDGIVDLYYLRDAISEYFFIEKDGKLVELQNIEISVLIEGDGMEHNDKMYVKNSNQYKGVLNFLFSDGTGLTKKISQTTFNYRSLINITKDYHNAVCTEYECIDFTRSSVQKLIIEVSAGLYYSEMCLKTSKSSQYNLRPGLTAQLRFVPLKSNTNWIFLIGLSYSANDFHGYFKNDLYYFSSKDTFDLSEKYSIIRLPLNVQYEFGSKKVQPFVSLGYSGCLYVGADYAAYGHLNERNYVELGRIKKFQHGFTGGAGIKFNLKYSRYLFLKAHYEYRIPSVNQDQVYDWIRHKTMIVNFGYAFSL